MGEKIQSFDSGKLATDLNLLFQETIGSRLNAEGQLYNDIAKKIAEQIEVYNANLEKAVKNGSVQSFLFENARFSNAVFDLLEKEILERESGSFIDLMEGLKLKSYYLLAVIPETAEVSEQIKKLNIALQRERSLKINARKEKSKSFKPGSNIPPKEEDIKSAFEQYKRFPNRNFFFQTLLINNLKAQITDYESFLKSILGLMTYLQNLDVQRVKLFDEFVAGNYNLEAIADRFQLHYNKDELDENIQRMHEAGNRVYKQLTEKVNSLLNAYNHGETIEVVDYKGGLSVEKDLDRLTVQISKLRSNWQNTIFLLSEDWKIDLEIHAFRFFILKEFFNFSDVINASYTIPIEGSILQMGEALTNLKSSVAKIKDTDEKSFKSSFTEAKIEFKRIILLKIIPAIKETVIKAELPKSIDNIETGTANQFNQISNKRYVLKHPDYTRPTERSQFESISLNGLVGYEFMPGLKKVFPNLKSAFIQHVQLFESRVAEIPEIIDFAVGTSISYYEKEHNISESVKITTEGIERAEHKLNEISTMHRSFIESEVETLKKSMEQFINEITAIADSESAFQINMRVARLKAIEKSKAFRIKIFNRIKNFLPIALGYTSRGISLIQRSSERIGRQFRLEQNQEFITSDTSDYLSATEVAINKLPFIYQRLFKNEPLDSFELFVTREKPLEELSLAYRRWQDGRFAPVIIVGEKGSGKTTIVSWFLKNKLNNEAVVSLSFHEVNKSPEAIYAEIEDHAMSPSLTSSTAGIKKAVFVIDGLERLFNPEVNGFKYLLKTMKLISETNHRIFWIAISHLYSWYFMDKSYKLSDYFAYHIKLTELNPADLKNMIHRRHNISGFRLIYEHVPSKKSIVSLKLTSAKETQASLEEAYFKSLTEFNKNNLSQAFLYWLRSTTRVENDVIYVRQISEVNNNFIKFISLPKMIALKNILIQNGITLEGQAKFLGQSPEMSKLSLDQMLDDGLLIKNNEFYLINPLIYSQIIKQMYTLNLLH